MPSGAPGTWGPRRAR